jgi:hypothetical protein
MTEWRMFTLEVALPCDLCGARMTRGERVWACKDYRNEWFRCHEPCLDDIQDVKDRMEAGVR